MRNPRFRFACLAILLAPPQQAAAQPRTIELSPPGTQINFTTYAMGLFAMAGHFTRFHGELRLDTANPGGCTVTVDIETASLTMADKVRARLAVGPKLLDAAAFPHLDYHGTCTPNAATGQLTMHGVTAPVLLTINRSGATLVATGRLKRQDFGVSGLPGLIGRTIQIALSVALPDDLAHLAQP